MHYQIYPNAQSKLVRVNSGTIFDVIIDVREKSELISGKLKSSKNIPLSKIDSNKKIDKNLTCYVYCAGGYRSVIACSILRRDRFKELVNIESGFSGISKLI